jgi:hypothetical protein
MRQLVQKAMSDARASRDAAPFILRIAGLSTDRIAPFATDLVASHVAPALQLEGELDAIRGEMIERIDAVLTSAEPALRRFLLQLKRDCFNRRSLRKHERSPHWPALRELIDDLADRSVEIEKRLEHWSSELQAAYERERERELRHLESLLEDRGFVRGITLASPVLLENVHRLNDAGRGRKATMLRNSLLRYASRAALKTSPFSALTRLAIGLVGDAEDTDGLRLVGHGWQARSLLRFKRHVLDQDYGLLLGYGPFRDAMPVALNSFLLEVDDGRLCLMRAGAWKADAGAAELSYTLPSLVHVASSGPLVAWLRQNTAGRPWRRDALLRALEEKFAEGRHSDQIRTAIDKLLDIGFLQVQPPWPSNTGHLEARMLEHLRSLPADPGLAPVIDAMARIVALQESYATATEPLRVVQALEHELEGLWEATRALGGLAPSIRRNRLHSTSLYEDVFLLPADVEPAQHERPWQELARIPRATVDRIVRSTRPLAKLAHLYAPQHDFILAIEAFAAAKWPGQREVSLLALFREAQPLWRQYTKFLADRRHTTDWQAYIADSFDPFGSRAMAELRHWRTWIWRQVENRAHHGQDESVFSSAAIAGLLSEVPARFTPDLDFCLMLQPADAEGQRWMLNRLYDGFGRYGSRYTPVMPEPLRRRYTAHCAERSVYEQQGQRTELLDVLFTYGDTLNVHAVQTARVLELPGEHIDVPAAGRLHLGDLRFRWGEPDASPTLIDDAGNSYTPVHLGVANHTFMPPLVKFLSALGPGENLPVALPRHVHEKPGMTLTNRVRLDDVIVSRKRWHFDPSALPPGLFDLPEPQAFVALHRWRMAHDIPERVFLVEEIRDEVYKPQFLDLTSPAFLSVLRGSSTARGRGITFYELLPAPECFPADESGRRWAVELLIDTLSLRPQTIRHDLTPKVSNRWRHAAPSGPSDKSQWLIESREHK